MSHVDGDSAAMTAAEFRIARDRLGVSGEWLAGELGVTLRTIRRWENGTAAIPAGAASDMAQILDATADFINAIADELLQAEPDEAGNRWVLAYASEEMYALAHPGSPWPSGWHRAAMGRVAELVPGVRIHYAGLQE